MYELMLTMLERLGIIVTVALVLTRLRFFRQLVHKRKTNKIHQLTAMLFFGFFGIIGTYTGLTLNTDTLHFNPWFNHVGPNEAIANSRVIGIVIAGLLGGYKVGIGAGLIAGLHRYTLGGFTAFACGISAILAGLLSGTVRKRFKTSALNPMTALITGALAEFLQMTVILLTAKPFPRALTLVQEIGLPMIIANGIGSLLFILIIQTVLNEEEKAGAIQAQKALRLAELTIKPLREGLTVISAKRVCEILISEVDANAISITNAEKILAHVGLADDHHKTNVLIQTDITKVVLKEGELRTAKHSDIHCKDINCPLAFVIVAPLKRRDETIGTMKFYFQSEKGISHINIELIRGLSSLLSNQLELAEAEYSYKMAKDLEIKALQAQIHPHFLFNTLNTVVSLIRTEPTKARKLMVSLSHFLRKNLTATTKSLISLEEELKHVKAYLEIEETRFVDRLLVTYDIDERLLSVDIPPLTLQPLVENAIKHGIKEKDSNCNIMMSIKQDSSYILISVQDNGKGIDKSKLEHIGKSISRSTEGTGIGLYNVNKRLIMVFGEASALDIKSSLGLGTKIQFKIPVQIEGGVDYARE